MKPKYCVTSNGDIILKKDVTNETIVFTGKHVHCIGIANDILIKQLINS